MGRYSMPLAALPIDLFRPKSLGNQLRALIGGMQLSDSALDRSGKVVFVAVSTV